MKEYTLVFKEGISTGLRKNARTVMGQQGFVEANGAMVDHGVMVNLDNLSSYDFTILGCTFPFPQVFQLKNYTIVCTSDKIYGLSNGALNLLYTASAVGSTWTVADFYHYLLFSNGVELVMHSSESGTWSKYIASDIPQSLCVCDLNGQIIAGGPGASVSSGFLG